ncbi:Phosphopantetheine adenylyltransferase [Corynebacterium ciconiae DSM 44920]|uniref:pantetheine-phosphate adenylyltransferase n=1 Tax=Corynebacterium ciconiae TaxID=227319 RepID=UPI000360E69C|nr:pantetheine-phosphate adenylyltransferase [Corynebacterium ciconiae]WKD61072.1 Phosphopantetheine adenylyltransferase [Corynebacterium ciconiae DSM 44920]
MPTRAVCPGSFDPVTLGHLDIITRSAASFDEVVVLITHNPHKHGMFTAEERAQLVTEATTHLPNVSVDTWTGLLVDYTQREGIDVIVKGLRSSLDYEYELPMAHMNKRLCGIDTFFLLTEQHYGHISSTLCKEVARYGGDVSSMLPEPVAQAMNAKLSEE